MRMVSIVMPYYNASRYIKETVQAIILQSFKDWELVIVDDCSTEPNVSVILEEIASMDERIRIARTEKNGGAGVARNFGIKLAKGRYLAFCDSDDWWYPNKLEEQLRFMENNGYAFTCTYYEDADEDLNVYYTMKQPLKQNYNKLLGGCNAGTPGIMIDRSVVRDVQMPALRRAEDWGCWMGVLKQVDYLYTCPMPLWKYRHIKGSESSNKLKQLKSVIEMYNSVLGYSKVSSVAIAYFYFLPNNIFKKLRKYL